MIFHWCALQIYSCDALSMGESRKFGLGGGFKGFAAYHKQPAKKDRFFCRREKT